MDPASITLIALGAATLVWSIWQSWKHGHLCKSSCTTSYDSDGVKK